MDKIYRRQTGGRPMLGLANQSPFIAASELARRRLSDCSFATRMTLSIGFAAKMLKNPHSEIPNPQLKRGSHGGTKTQREKTE